MESNQEKKDKKIPIDADKMTEVLNIIYNKAINGIEKISMESVEELANEYSSRYFYPADAAKELAKTQIQKCGISGFITGLGGLITLPITLPANITSVLYIQIRMIAAIAKIAGYDIHSDKVQTMVYACLTGQSITDIAKQFGIKAGEKFAEKAIEKIPGKIINAINKKVGFRLVTKFGEKGVINIAKMLPAVGGVISGTVDVVSTKIIANNAYSVFIKKMIPDYSKKSRKGADIDIIDAEFTEVIDMKELDD